MALNETYGNDQANASISTKSNPIPEIQIKETKFVNMRG